MTREDMQKLEAAAIEARIREIHAEVRDLVVAGAIPAEEANERINDLVDRLYRNGPWG